MISLTTLQSKQNPITERCVRLLNDVGRERTFNPSIDIGDSDTNGDIEVAIAFRAPDLAGAIGAHLLVSSGDGPPTITDLSAHCAPITVADPKLVRIDGKRWVTFNSGWSDSSNDLYLLRVDPTLGSPVCCHVDGRRAIEKNWAFFEHAGRLRALYSLSPAIVLDAALPDGSTDVCFVPMAGTLDAATEQARSRRALVRRGHSIGTQPIQHDGRLHLIAHEKFEIPRRRTYVGRAATVDLTGDLTNEAPRVDLSPRRLIHSLRSTLGARTRPNPHLLSCSYFSGLARHRGTTYLGYGINDVDAAFAATAWKDLW